MIVAALLDIVANLLLAKSQGFRRMFIGFASLGMVGLAFYALSLAVRDMDLAVAYAMWGGFGIPSGRPSAAGSLLGQRLKPLRVARHGAAHRRHDGVEAELAQKFTEALGKGRKTFWRKLSSSPNSSSLSKDF